MQEPGEAILLAGLSALAQMFVVLAAMASANSEKRLPVSGADAAFDTFGAEELFEDKRGLVLQDKPQTEPGAPGPIPALEDWPEPGWHHPLPVPEHPVFASAAEPREMRRRADANNYAELI